MTPSETLKAKVAYLERRVVDLEAELSLARSHARHWEDMGKDLRKQIQRLRMTKDTDRIEK
jgi:hypothetical protein